MMSVITNNIKIACREFADIHNFKVARLGIWGDDEIQGHKMAEAIIGKTVQYLVGTDSELHALQSKGYKVHILGEFEAVAVEHYVICHSAAGAYWPVVPQLAKFVIQI